MTDILGSYAEDGARLIIEHGFGRVTITIRDHEGKHTYITIPEGDAYTLLAGVTRRIQEARE